MILREFEGLKWHQFELLAEFPLIQATFTRHGGHSKGDLASLNFGTMRGDALENVQANFNKVRRALGLSTLISAKGCHGPKVHALEDLLGDLPISDGLSTKLLGFGLLITHADCQAAIFYDPVHHAMANVHCGWRGNTQNIYRETVNHMQRYYGSRPADLHVCISPSLGPENSEFIHYRTEIPEALWDFQYRPTYFDLWKMSEWQLEQAGVLPQHIQIARIDTFACKEDYFSHRRNRQTGRQATICALL